MINDLEICIAIVFYKPILQSNDSSMIFEASLDKNLGDGMMPTPLTSNRSASQQLCMVGLLETSPLEL